MEEPLVPTQLDIFRLLELPLVLQLPLPFGEEVEPPREDELELLRVCKNKKHALTQSQGDRQQEKKLKRKLSSRSEVSFTLESEMRETNRIIQKRQTRLTLFAKNTIYESVQNEKQYLQGS